MRVYRDIWKSVTQFLYWFVFAGKNSTQLSYAGRLMRVYRDIWKSVTQFLYWFVFAGKNSTQLSYAGRLMRVYRDIWKSVTQFLYWFVFAGKNSTQLSYMVFGVLCIKIYTVKLYGSFACEILGADGELALRTYGS